MTLPAAAMPLDGLRLSELLGALSHALDLSEGQPEGHCVRACWIGLHLGRDIGLSEAEYADLYYTLMLKDLGCSSNAARICQLYLTDDLGFKRKFKLVGDTLPEILGFVVSQTGATSALAARLRATFNILRNGGAIARELIETRCDRGALIARRMHFSDAVAAGIRSLDEHWDGRGKPDGLAGAAIPIFAQVALLAQVADVFHAASGVAGAVSEMRRRRGTWFSPRLVDAFERVAADPDVWTPLGSPDLPVRLFALEPAQSVVQVSEAYLDDVAAAFADVIDSKSPFTGGHSARVALFTDMIAAELGFDGVERRWMRRGALLHDMGKLGVSNAILDKPGKLDAAEWTAMQAHSAMGEDILSRIAVFGRIARMAGAHHERLDGKGYPRGLLAQDIDIETRVLTTADIFDALTAERPYRGAMPLGQALGIMRDSIGTALDPRCLSALESAIGKLGPAGAAVDRSFLDETQPIPAALFDHMAGRLSAAA